MARPMRQQFEDYVNSLQDRIVSAFEKLDPNAPPFKRDSWVRAQGGVGRSCVFAVPQSPSGTGNTDATALEKAGVNVSVVHGVLPPPAIQQMRADHSSIPYDPDSQSVSSCTRVILAPLLCMPITGTSRSRKPFPKERREPERFSPGGLGEVVI